MNFTTLPPRSPHAYRGTANWSVTQQLAYAHTQLQQENVKEAHDTYLRLAQEYNVPEAYYHLGMMCKEGCGKNLLYQSVTQAALYFEYARKMNHFQATYELGLLYYQGYDDEDDQFVQSASQALTCFLTMVDSDPHLLTEEEEKLFVQAAFYTGEIYFKGNEAEPGNATVIKQDFSLAFFYYQKAAAYDHSEAIYVLGYNYYNAKGVSQDFQQAIFYFNKIYKTHKNAAHYLGFIYEEGMGVRKDAQQAFLYYQTAARLHSAFAKRRLGFFYSQPNSVVRQDMKKALDYYLDAAKLGDMKAMCDAADMYYDQSDYRSAYLLYFECAKDRQAHALYRLGKMYADGRGVEEKDLVKAAFYYGQAAQEGHARAAYLFGRMHHEGWGVEKDHEKAHTFLTYAAEHKVQSANRYMKSIPSFTCHQMSKKEQAT